MEVAKKAKKKIDRTTAMHQLGLPILETVDGVAYAPGNRTLQSLVLSGNDALREDDVVAVSAALERHRATLDAHLQRIKVQRIPALKGVATRHQLCDVLQF